MPAQEPSVGSPQPLVRKDPGDPSFPPAKAVPENEGPQARESPSFLSPFLRSLLDALSIWPT
jgi:hypothetical protein